MNQKKCSRASLSDFSYFSTTDLTGLSTTGGTLVLLSGTNFGPGVDAAPNNLVYAATFSKTCVGCKTVELSANYISQAKHRTGFYNEYNFAATNCKVPAQIYSRF